MSESNLYYIYIDTKIHGTIDQLINYFQTNIFTSKACINVICKSYKEIDKYIHIQFRKNNIPYQTFKKFSEIILEKDKTIFYLFNAQSNCRMVANRNLAHVFVTHGESNKVASIKPIIRIYDFVITSGQVGIDRYLRAGLFNEQDINDQRIICMGNTFVGENNYCFSKKSKALLYAPTWEGGIPSENYSSIDLLTAKFILEISNNNNIDHIYIQLHPNLGHRDQKYIKKCKELILFFKKNKKKVILKSSYRWNNLKLFCFLNKISFENITQRCAISFAVTDVSAMEVQLIQKYIPTYVIFKKNIFITKKLNSFYDVYDINNLDIRKLKLTDDNIKYIYSYTHKELENKQASERVNILTNFVNKLKRDKDSKNNISY